jgi:hypothetical protein
LAFLEIRLAGVHVLLIIEGKALAAVPALEAVHVGNGHVAYVAVVKPVGLVASWARRIDPGFRVHLSLLGLLQNRQGEGFRDGLGQCFGVPVVQVDAGHPPILVSALAVADFDGPFTVAGSHYEMNGMANEC